MTKTTKADFKLFLVLWNQKQKLTTPVIHFRMADWLERSWRSGDKRLLLMAFRSSGKSTLTGLFCAWLLYTNPNLRIMVLAADNVLASKMVRNVKRIIERHILTSDLKPDKPDQWASDRFTVNRKLETRDPSMLAAGISTNITGNRADIIVCDDVEVPNTSDTAHKREDLRDRLSEIEFILVPGGTQIYIGTPHTYFTIYAKQPRRVIGEERTFLCGFKRHEIPVLDESGNSVWPERFEKSDIERIKQTTGPNKFASQMMLKPVNIADGRLDPSLLQIYDDELDYTPEIRSLFLGETKLVSASAFWDPAFGSAKGDRSVLACIFTDDEGNYYLQNLTYIKCDETIQTDEATYQCELVTAIAKKYYLPCLSVEINGIGKFLPGLLRNKLASNNVPCTVLEASSSRSKELRILEDFDTVLASQRLYVHRSVIDTPFMMEMQEWQPSRSKGHDDGLDAVAGALADQPDRLKRIYGSGMHQWMSTNTIHKADTNFKI